MLTQYMAAVAVWSSARRGQPGGTLTDRVACILSTSVKPMTRTEIAARLADEVSWRGHRVVMADLLAILRRHRRS
jgi:hypothetical protein